MKNSEKTIEEQKLRKDWIELIQKTILGIGMEEPK
jgi:hypothetical protein